MLLYLKLKVFGAENAKRINFGQLMARMQSKS